eukprot:TRINITY_DN5857_c1_g1_i1.p1 TRINITY_DN5857_c1_g1~~TRINITY_DN5857_c1_g1_i1.p1  ORF type:complete len:832 (+),score=201.94 TRINITY_DN5857_c1_g1_i1:69-2564(+)
MEVYPGASSITGGPSGHGSQEHPGYTAQSPRLPPLAAVQLACDGATAQLVQGLRKLYDSTGRDIGASPRRTGIVERPLRSISYLGHVANQRVEQADLEFVMREHQMFTSLRGSAAQNQAATGGAASSSKAGAASGSAEGAGGEQGLPRVRPVKQDEVITETIPLRGIRYYKVALPKRLAVVTVTVTKTSGPSPALLGSTQNKRPDDKDHDLQGKDDKLVYEHALMPSRDDGEEGEGEQRKRVTVPSCRELYFSATAGSAECSFKFVVTFGNMKIKITPGDLARQVTKVKHGWEAKLANITKSQQHRDDFEQRLQEVEEAKRARMQLMSHGQNFVERNQSRLTAETSPRMKAIKLQQQALRSCYRQDMAQHTRAKLEDEKEERMVQWMNRAENKKKEREEQERLAALQQQRAMMQECWFERVYVAAFLKMTAAAFQAKKKEIETLNLEYASATVLHGFFRRALVRKRRHMIWRNAVKLRTAMVVYARTMLPLAKALAAPAIQQFIATHANNKESPSIMDALQRYRTHIVRLQRRFLKNQRMRRAYVSCLLPAWKKCQNKAYETFLADRAAAAVAAAKANAEHLAQLQGVMGDDDKKKGKKAQKSSSWGPAARAKTGEGKKGKESEEEFEEMPEYVGKIVLYNYVMDMQQTFLKRVKSWEDLMQQASSAAEIENFCGTEGDADSDMKKLKLARPRKIYLDQAELTKLVRRHMEIWHKGGYVHIKGNHFRILRMGFRAFAGGRRARFRSGAAKPSSAGAGAGKSRAKGGTGGDAGRGRKQAPNKSAPDASPKVPRSEGEFEETNAAEETSAAVDVTSSKAVAAVEALFITAGDP